jgi:Tol biopolymer transport system component
VKGKYMRLMAGLLGIMIFSASAKMPGFDIYVGDLGLQDNRLRVSHFKALTDRAEYDNQPLFLPDGDSLLYTAALVNNKIEQEVEQEANQKTEQTDSMLISLESGQILNLTNSPESEYSPTLMPSGKSFSVIRAVNDKQELWRYPLYPQQKSFMPASELLTNINPIGYHAWVDDNRVILFVLGQPQTLQLADVRKQSSQVLDDNIGPSLFKIPHSSLMSYTAFIGEGEDIQWQLKSYHPQTGQIELLTTLPKGAFYYAWAGNGYAISAVDSILMQWDKEHIDKGWRPFADVSEICPKGVTRLTTNSQNSKIALVCTL